jgi:hypothetical protein
MILNELAIKYETDKSSQVHNYTKIYEDILLGRNIKSLLEIGVHTGASHRMWRDYFPDGIVYAIDHNVFDVNRYGELGDRIIHYVADQSKIDDLENAMTFFNTKFDLIVDDSSHYPEHILISLKTIFKYLNDDGLYIIEDIENPEILRNDLRDYNYWTANTVNGMANSNLIVIKKT